MSFIIESEVSEQYLREPNAIEGFREAVENGQVRLALQILVEIVDAFASIFEAAFEEDSDEQPEQTIFEEPKTEEPKKEEPKKSVVKKTVEEKSDIQEV